MTDFASSNGLPWYLPLAFVTWATQMFVFHCLGYAFQMADTRGWLRSAKVRNVDRKTYAQLLPRVLLNQCLILLPSMLVLEWAGLAFVGPAHAPARLYYLGYFVAIGLGYDVVQYVTHRFILHRQKWMKSMGHALHHSTGASKAISACYMSGADFFLEIVLPYLVPLVLIGGGGSNVVFHCVVASMGAFGGLYEHSGYDFAVPVRQSAWAGVAPKLVNTLAGLISSHAHAEHHRRGNVSFSDGFGLPGLCDAWLGTRWDKVAEARMAKAQPASPRDALSL